MSSFVLNPIFGTSVNSGKEILIWKEIEKLVKIHFPDLLDQLKSIYLRFNQVFSSLGGGGVRLDLSIFPY